MLTDVVACCVCGVVHSGTTIAMKMLRNHPDLCAPPEGHVLRLGSVKELKTLRKRRSVIKSGWHLTPAQLEEAARQKTIEDLYRYLRSVSLTIVDADRNKRLVDKTPSYVYRLHEAMSRSENVPFIVIKKDPRNFYYSLSRRGMEWSKIEELYRHSYEACVPQCLHAFGKRLLVVSWERFMFKPVKVMRQVCSHIGIEFKENLYTPAFFEKRLKPELIYSYKNVKPKGLAKVHKAFKKHFLDI